MSFIDSISSTVTNAKSEFGTFGAVVVTIFALALIFTLVLFGSAVSIWVLNTLFALALPFTWQTLLASFLLNLKLAYVGSSSVEKLLKAK